MKDRIATNKTFLAQLKTLLAGQEDGSEDAIKTAEQIKAVELALANDRVALAQEVLKAAAEAKAMSKAKNIALEFAVIIGWSFVVTYILKTAEVYPYQWPWLLQSILVAVLCAWPSTATFAALKRALDQRSHCISKPKQ